MSLVLGIDIGTQSVKAVIYDADQKMITASAARSYHSVSAGRFGRATPGSMARCTGSRHRAALR